MNSQWAAGSDVLPHLRRHQEARLIGRLSNRELFVGIVELVLFVLLIYTLASLAYFAQGVSVQSFWAAPVRFFHFLHLIS